PYGSPAAVSRFASTSEGASMAAAHRRSVRPAAIAFVAVLALALPRSASAQPGGCTLAPDEHNPSEKILRCGDDLTLRSARGTQYKLITKEAQPLPSGAELNSGALLI